MRLKQIWNYLWHGEGALSWVVTFAVAFILVKFVLLPVGGLVLGTSFPVVAVVSSSMEHPGGFDVWWEKQHAWYETRGITKEIFLTYPQRQGFNKGDVMVLFGTDFNTIIQGDVVVFWGKHTQPIIHRVVNRTDMLLTTKGDNNLYTFPELGEDKNSQTKYLGRAVLRVPYAGWPKIWAVELFRVFTGGR